MPELLNTTKRDPISENGKKSLRRETWLFLLAYLFVAVSLTCVLALLYAILITKIGFVAIFGILLAAVICAGFGMSLMTRTGQGLTFVIPPNDYQLVKELLQNDKFEAISQYIKLAGLTGTVGFFTKLGIGGLPLATISLTVFFTILALIVPFVQQFLFSQVASSATELSGISPSQLNTLLAQVSQLKPDVFFDLSKLTLGAFIGSYVSRRPASDRKQDGGID